MYRLLSLRKIKIQQLDGMTLCNNEIKSRLNMRERTCALCKQWSNISTTFTRHRCTIPDINFGKALKNKRQHRFKKYAELLVVTDKSTSQKRAKVKKLTSKDLKFLTLTNLNLSELYKLKAMMVTGPDKVFEEHTYNNLAVVEDIPAIVENTSATLEVPVQSVIIPSISKTSSVSKSNKKFNKDEILYKDAEYLEFEAAHDEKESIQMGTTIEDLETFQTRLPTTNAFHPETLDEEPPEAGTVEEVKEILKKRNNLEAKLEIISRTLAAYIEVCSILKDPQRGINTLWAYKHRRLKNEAIYPPMVYVNIYNAALKGIASKGNVTKLEEIVRYAKTLNVHFNAQSYAAILECLGRSDVEKYISEIKMYGAEAIQKGFTFDRILSECIFGNDEQVQVLKAMMAYNKSYIPKYTPPDVQYDNHLLNSLNNDAQLQYHEKEIKAESGIFTQNKMKEMISEQLEIEKLGFVTISNIQNRSKPTEDVIKYREALEEHIEAWKASALKAHQRELITLAAKRHSSRLEPYMKSIPTEDIVNIMVDEAKLIAQGSETYSPTAYLLYRALGNRVYSRFQVLRKKETAVLDKIMKIHSDYCNVYMSSRDETEASRNLNTRQIWQWLEHKERPNGSSIELYHQPWVASVLLNIGKYLYHIIMKDFKIDVNVMKGGKKKNLVPAFYTIFRHHGRIIKEEVKPHPVLSKLYRASAPETLTFPTYDVPMRCPPVPWSSLNLGGYLVTHTDFIRLPPQAMTQKERLEEMPLPQLYPSFDALNQLASVPWKVNQKIFDCILEVFLNGGSSRLSVPEHPSTLPVPLAPFEELNKQQKFAFFRQKLQYRRKKAEMYSLWCDCLYRLSLANHFKNDTFWLPHNMDFRGRVYPVPPHLSHLGSDLARSMLVFAEARPLGPNGLDWLKIHLINLTGLKKRDPVEERLLYANEIMDKILDSAKNPLTGKMWWASSDEQWQTLACCMEIAAAMEHPDPAQYKSHFPIHQDGSCNGLQHYAALGRDKAGGYSVNLTPASKPQDVYSAVVALVDETRRKDAESGVALAKILEGFVRRKVIKQTVMTTVYGVTRFGARLQIARQLKDIEEFPRESIWAGSTYLTGRTFDSLRTMFTSTREIQDWFTDCARLISSACGENVEWVTPLGLPIVQPYFKYKTIKASGYYEPFRMDKYEKPNVMKQKNAFPPNFIHSLDSSHMMLTSLHCEKAGITFVSVHDCYWTHPSTVHIMNKICREQFVALHSEPILENLAIFFINKYASDPKDLKELAAVGEQAVKKKLKKLLVKLPKTGNLDINHVLDSVYFFS